MRAAEALRYVLLICAGDRYVRVIEQQKFDEKFAL